MAETEAEAELDLHLENSSSFWTSFTSRIAEIREELRTLRADVAGDSERLQKMKVQLSGLQVYATESTPLLPAYDVRRSQEELELLGKDIKETELLLKPKKKFTFATRSSNSKVTNNLSERSFSVINSKQKNEIDHDNDKNENGKTDTYPSGSYVISSKKNEFISLSPEKLKLISAYGANVQLLLKDCDDVIISSPTIHGSIRLEKINNSKIYLGPCCTSVYVEECSNITIYLACHQLRIHRSHNCFFYVKVNSHPIIEDCTGFGFAPYSLSYDGIQDDYKSSSLLEASCWNNIVDFRWHRNNVPSPHWYVLPVEERQKELSADLQQAGWNLLSIDTLENNSKNDDIDKNVEIKIDVDNFNEKEKNEKEEEAEEEL